jgi:hypothetical protein
VYDVVHSRFGIVTHYMSPDHSNIAPHRIAQAAGNSVLCLREVWRCRFDEHVLGPRDKRRPATDQFDSFISALKGVLAAERRSYH